jgi:serine/threonine protein kinase
MSECDETLVQNTTGLQQDSISPGRNITVVARNGRQMIRKIAKEPIEDEFRIMAGLNCKEIGKVTELISPFCYIMEYYEKGGIEQHRLLDLELVRKHFERMCLCVRRLHTNNIVHLDIRLSNFVLNKKDELVLIDFGHAVDKNCTEIRRTLGTNKYNAPERFQGCYDGFKADIYSLGVVLFKLVTGVYPFKASTADISMYRLYKDNKAAFWEKIRIHLEKNQRIDRLEPAAVELIDLLLRENPNDRPSIDYILSHSFFLPHN